MIDDHVSDPRIEEYYALRPCDFHLVRRLEIRQDSEEDEDIPVLTMELAHKDHNDPRCLLLTFSAVRNLRLEPPTASLIYMSQLEIRSIRDRQWEGKNYWVGEAEQEETISFLCHSFSATIIERQDI